MNETQPAFSLPVRVYIEDTDAGGIVYYVNYLKFMERARTELMRSLGYRHYALAQENFQFVVRACEVCYHKPARIDDALEVTAEIERLGRAGLDFRQTVLREGEPLCHALVKIACVRADTMAPVAMPRPLHEAFKRRALNE
jgi:tol-pal system-associated acyl-CoA thioesterase